MDIIYALNHPNMLLAGIWARVATSIPDDLYLKVRYRLIFGKKLDLVNPKGFNEKLNWLKIYNRNPLYPHLVDKYEVKEYICNRIGEKYVIPTLGIWNSFDDINFDELPNQFVLKSTNGGGGTGVVICKDKKNFDFVSAKNRLEKSLNSNWKYEREWVYRDIKPRIIAEKYMYNEDGADLVDWKIFCFDGEPKLLFHVTDRYTPGADLKFDWYDMDLHHLPITSKGIPRSNKIIEMFPEWEQMKTIAKRLSEGFPHVRVDLYVINHNVYFGELTFFHDGGAVALEPEEWEYKIGSWIRLPLA